MDDDQIHHHKPELLDLALSSAVQTKEEYDNGKVSCGAVDDLDAAAAASTCVKSTAGHREESEKRKMQRR